jgi:hypothetical protein
MHSHCLCAVKEKKLLPLNNIYRKCVCVFQIVVSDAIFYMLQNCKLAYLLLLTLILLMWRIW